MQIDNRTQWSTDDLRAIISACVTKRGVPSTGLIVEIVTKRTGAWVRGRARIGMRLRAGRWMKLWLPTPHAERAAAHDTEFRVRAARVIDHEVAHLAGLTHSNMGERLRHCTQDVSHWLGDLPLRLAERPVSTTDDKARARDKQIEAARASVKRWERKLALAETMLAKWRRKLASRERARSQTTQEREAAGTAGT